MDDFLKRIQDFNRDRDVMRLQRMFNNSSILEIVGIERKETRHSKFLEWLFKVPEINTISENSPIMHLLDILVRRASEQQNQNEVLIGGDFMADIVTRNVSIKIDRVKAELATKGLKFQNEKNQEKTGLIDIYIKAYDKKNKRTIHICIENKLYTSEHDFQTTKYFAYMTGGKGLKTDIQERIVFNEEEYKCPAESNDIVLFAFLTPSSEFIMRDKKQLDELCECKNYIHINYQDIVNEILEPLIEDIATPRSGVEKIEQYVWSLGIPVRASKDGDAIDENDVEKKSEGDKDDNSNISKTIMATSSEILDKATSIWKNHKACIVTCLFPSKDNEELSKKFLLNRRDFLENLLFIKQHSETDKKRYHEFKLMILRLNEKKNNYLVKRGDSYIVLNQRQLAKEFAKYYCKYYIEQNGSDQDAESVIKQINEELSEVKSSNSKWTLFMSQEAHEKKKKENYSNNYIQLFKDDKGSPYSEIYVDLQIWDNKTNGKGYVNKLIDFIHGKNNSDASFKFEIIKLEDEIDKRVVLVETDKD